MKLTISKSKNAISYYVTESFRRPDGTSTSRIILKLGTEKTLKEEHGEDFDVKTWAQNYVKELNEKNRLNKPIPLSISIVPNVPYEMGEKRSFNVGNLLLRRELSLLGLNKIAKDIKLSKSFKYDFGQLLSDLVSSRVLAPLSKKSTFEYAKDHFLEEPTYEQHDVYRALSVIAENSEAIQSDLYKNSNSVIERNPDILFYDCTNFYFEVSDEDNIRRYGKSKEHRPNPIVQFGLFMDGNGIPLGFDIFAGNQNEQRSLQPLEKRIIQDYEINNAKMIVCTDAGLASTSNRKFNSTMHRDFITIQPIKTMSNVEQEWILGRGRSLKTNPLRKDENIELVKRDFLQNGWREDGDRSNKYFSLDDIDEDDPENYNKIYYKEKYLVDPKTKFEQRLIVTYSIKYKRFMEHKRASDIERAKKLIASNNYRKVDIKSQNDIRQYIESRHVTEDGSEVAKCVLSINEEQVAKAARYDGFYAVCTSLSKEDKPVSQIITINSRRWEIEESFMLMKSEFKSRPVYVYTEEHIKAHFTICFIALLLFRILEKKINSRSSVLITAQSLINTLREMNITKYDKFYAGAFKRTPITDILHANAGMRFDCDLLTPSAVDAAVKKSKKIMS